MSPYQKFISWVSGSFPPSIATPLRRRYCRMFHHKLWLLGQVRFGNLRRFEPPDDMFGWDTGTVIDRYYMEDFLAKYSKDIQGEVMEVGHDMYTVKFGGDRVTKSDVVHYVEGNPQATIVADLSNAANIPSNSFDCIIIVQTLQMIYDVKAAVKELYRILKQGGVVLATTNGTSKVGLFLGVDDWGTFWHMTAQSSRMMFEENFGSDAVSIQPYGNLIACVAFLHGMNVEDLTKKEINYVDQRYEVITGIRATKPLNNE